MEKNEKTQEVPAWVKIVGELSPSVQQLIGTLASQTVQNLSMLNLISCKLVNAIYHEAINAVIESEND